MTQKQLSPSSTHVLNLFPEFPTFTRNYQKKLPCYDVPLAFGNVHIRMHGTCTEKVHPKMKGIRSTPYRQERQLQRRSTSTGTYYIFHPRLLRDSRRRPDSSDTCHVHKYSYIHIYIPYRNRILQAQASMILYPYKNRILAIRQLT